jgi:serine/threonine protein kinase
VIHRDLKPRNVLFSLGTPKVIDFGIARALEVTSQHTRTDQMVGTVPVLYYSRRRRALPALSQEALAGCGTPANGMLAGPVPSSPAGCCHRPRRRSSGSTPSPNQYASSRCG